jgi:uncharacterized membrane protein HdeD (DUF308 family)
MPLKEFTDAWSAFLLRGLITVVFGLVIMLWPHVALKTVLVVFGIFAAADGAMALFSATRSKSMTSRLWLVIQGLVGVGAAAATWFYPDQITKVLFVLIGLWAIVRGVVDLLAALRLRRELANEWMLAASGLMSVLIGVFLATQPVAAALALLWVIGLYALVLGVLFTLFALRMRQIAKQI